VRQLSTPESTVFLNLSLDRHVLGFTILLTMVVTLLFGVAPVLRASRAAPMDALKQQTRATTARGRQTLTSWLVIVQVSLSLVLAVAAGLFIRTFSSLTTRPLGFDPAPVLLAKVDAHHTTDDAVQRIALYNSARDAVRRVPDVAEAALSLTTPVGPGQFTPLVEIDRISDTHGPVWANLISPGWFSTFQMPLLAGRDLTDRDRAGAPRVAVVNEAFARKFVAGNPVGHTITLYPHTPRAMGPIEIVGVVGDAVYASLRSPAPPTYYIPLAQFDYLPELGIRSIDISIRSKGAAPMSLARSVGPALTAVNPRLTLTFRPLVSQLDAALVRERLIAVLAGFFGMLAVLLAGLGLYGLTAYAVTSRRTEIGIRMALGAPAARVIRLIVARTSLMVGAGMILGVCASLWTSRFVRSLLYGVEPNDPVTLISALTLLAVVAGFSALLPARRAVRIDPAVVLRDS
jgi:predicted permease